MGAAVGSIMLARVHVWNIQWYFGRAVGTNTFVVPGFATAVLIVEALSATTHDIETAAVCSEFNKWFGTAAVGTKLYGAP